MQDDSTQSESLPEGGDEGEDAGTDASGDGDKALLEEARARFKIAMDAERENRALASDDTNFRAGEQWPADIKAARKAADRPCLTINKMPQFEQQVTNDQRQNRPTIKVHAVDDKADPKTAKILQGIIKHIEVNSSADSARDTAFEGAVRGGFGYYRIITEFSSPTSFEQDIKIKLIRDPFTVLLDPSHQEPDGSDAKWGFIFERMPKDEYKRAFGESKLAADGAWDLEQSQVPDWLDSESVMVAEYYYIEYESRDLCLLDSGDVVFKEELDQILALRAGEGKSAKVVKERKAQIPQVKWCKINGVEPLEKTDWLGAWIPILPVYGGMVVADGKLIRESLTRHAKDPARMYNLWKSYESEAITAVPKAPFIAAKGQIAGFEADWKAANTRALAVLEYNPIAVNGQVMPPPQRQSFEPAVQAITQASMLAADEVKSVIGIHDASLGARSNETSGIAIQRRNQQAQASNFHFTDNLTRTIKHEGRILVDLIPKIFDTARIARIIGEDGEQKPVKVNQEYQDESGQTLKHDLGVGKYDVTVDTGPSYATRRQETAAFMQEAVKAYPPTMQIAGDLVFKHMDVPGANELSERFKKTLAPGLIDDPKAQNIPPQIKAQMAQMGQMLEQLQKDRADLLSERESKLLDIESRERIEMAKLETQLEIKRAELDAKDSLALLTAQIGQIESRMALLHVNEPIQGGAPGAPQGPPQDPGPPDGAMSADPGMAEPPTGGEPPAPPMEGPL